MDLSRRTFLKSAASVSACSVFLPACLSPSPSQSETEQWVERKFAKAMQKKSFIYQAAHPLISRDSSNGGLAYDECLFGDSRRIYTKQPVSRVEDISKKSTGGVLPFFHILNFTDASEDDAAAFRTALDFLVRDLCFRSEDLSFTTTELAKPYIPTMATYGIKENQITWRSLEEAKMIGDGSGFFAPKDHPQGAAYPTMSIEYKMPDNRFLELAEISFGANKGAGFGEERVAMALENRYKCWGDAIPQLKEAVAREVINGAQLPPGYDIIIRA